MPNCEAYLSIQYSGVRLTIRDRDKDFQYMYSEEPYGPCCVGMSKRENRLDSRHSILFF